MVHEYEALTMTTTKGQREAFMRDQRPGSDTRIWVARNDDDWWGAGTIAQSSMVYPNCRLRVTHAGLGRIYLVTMTPAAGDMLPDSLSEVPTRHDAYQIWPPQGDRMESAANELPKVDPWPLYKEVFDILNLRTGTASPRQGFWPSRGEDLGAALGGTSVRPATAVLSKAEAPSLSGNADG